MIFPRSLNLLESNNLKTIKEWGFAYELKFDNSKILNGFSVNIFELKESWFLNQKMTKTFLNRIDDYIKSKSNIQLKLNF